MAMGGIVERLRGLLGGGDGDVTDITQDPRDADSELAIDAVDEAVEDAQSDAPLALTDAAGSLDD